MQPIRTPPGLAVAVIVLGLLALLAPFRDAAVPATRVGVLLALAASIELFHGIRRATAEAKRSASVSGLITTVMGLLLISAPYVAGQALAIGLALWFAFDGLRYAVKALKAADTIDRRYAVLATAGNLSVTLLILLFRGQSFIWTIAAAGALRIFGIAWNIVLSPVYTSADADATVIDDLGLGDRPEIAAMGKEIEEQERARASIDRVWTCSFIATLFAIHIGRMGSDRTLLGLIAPAVAVLGDMLIAVIVTLAIIVPIALSWRKSTRWLERLIWRWYLPGKDQTRGTGFLHWIAGAWLRFRLRMAMRLRESRYSIPLALQHSLAMGLPFAAIMAATTPVWGMSWYFDTENWAAGIWNSWAESRTDEWREAMVRAVVNEQGLTSSTFAVDPSGIRGGGDFSFLVIGDPGEGDGSQQSLRDQVLFASAQDDVRFVVISSDVVYPTGAMKDYEQKFWMQLKGVSKPVYAIPGNHDWYDALEAFLATFLEPGAARVAIRARVEADLRMTSTTDVRIEQLIGEADRLRRAYRVPTGFQRGPFFEIQTETFALLAIDTGIVKRIDPVQEAWLRAALDRARGKLTMAVLGHPFYAGGHDQTLDNPPFQSLRRLLTEAGVSVVMAGDTHDLEYYADPLPDGSPGMRYIVNGGGGAYLSFGTALAWPAQPPLTDWGFYPARAAVFEKVDAQTPWWKRPAWWWTRSLGAWPFSPEWLSAVFDSNVSPFYQSFVKVQVEPAARRVRLLPYGTNGPLTWRDLERSPDLLPVGVDPGAVVEWTVPMAR